MLPRETRTDDAAARYVVLMLENRSFDHVLGALARSGVIDADGGTESMSNVGLNGNQVGMSPALPEVRPDPRHDLASVKLSLHGNASGFVLADELVHGVGEHSSRIMSFYDVGDMPVTHELAKTYCVADRWFSSVPTGTWPNRPFAIAATSNGRVTNSLPPSLYRLPTVFDQLGPDKWVCYNDQLPNVVLIRDLALEWLRTRHKPSSRFRSIKQFESDCAEGDLPFLSWIEPVYLFDAADDAHPPHDIALSERLIGRVYLALRSSPAWERVRLIVTYDEHGGFFDHVPPHGQVPSTGIDDGGFAFTTLGPRVPTLLIGPGVHPHSAWRPRPGMFADHTSIIATLLRSQGLSPLTPRDALAADTLDAFSDAGEFDHDLACLEAVQTWMAEQPVQLMAESDGTRLVGSTGDQLLDSLFPGDEGLSDLAHVVRSDVDVEMEAVAVRGFPADVELERALAVLGQLLKLMRLGLA